MNPARVLAVMVAVMMPAASGRAHVNSPHIFLEEPAGPYSLLVIVHMPPAVPGEAQVQVRVQDTRPGEKLEVWVRDVPPQGEEHAVGWTRAAVSAADPAFFTHPFSLMVLGLWQLDVRVAGARGEGQLRVPIPARVAVPRAMPLQLGLAQILLVLLLMLSARSIGIGLGRDAHRPAGVDPTPADERRGRRAALLFTGGFACLLAFIVLFWIAVTGQARAQSGSPLVGQLYGKGLSIEPGKELSLELQVVDESGEPVVNLAPDHGKMMHLLVVKMPDLSHLFHLHPALVGAGRFGFRLVAPEPGQYLVFADLLFASGEGQTVITRFQVPEGPSVPAALAPGGDPDDSFATAPALGALAREATAYTTDGPLEVRWRRSREALRKDEFHQLTFEVKGPAGVPIEGGLEPYMGMLGHLLIERVDGGVFAHVHPMGTVGGRMAMGAMGHDMAAMRHAPGGASEVSFPFAFPSSGLYRMWVQVKVGGSVRTGVFDTKVE